MKKIRKSFGTSVLKGNVVDSLNFNNPDSAPSIKAVNEVLKGVILYEDETGFNVTSTNILSDSIENYKYREIIYKRSANVATTGKLPNKYGMSNILQAASSTAHYAIGITLEGKNVTISYSYRIPFNTVGVEQTTDIYIVKVIGYK